MTKKLPTFFTSLNLSCDNKGVVCSIHAGFVRVFHYYSYIALLVIWDDR